MFEIETNHCKREKLQIGRTKTIEREKKSKILIPNDYTNPNTRIYLRSIGKHLLFFMYVTLNRKVTETMNINANSNTNTTIAY